MWQFGKSFVLVRCLRRSRWPTKTVFLVIFPHHCQCSDLVNRKHRPRLLSLKRLRNDRNILVSCVKDFRPIDRFLCLFDRDFDDLLHLLQCMLEIIQPKVQRQQKRAKVCMVSKPKCRTRGGKTKTFASPSLSSERSPSNSNKGTRRF